MIGSARSRRSSVRLLAARWRQFKRTSRGVAAVEFALIAPLMVLMYLGTTEVSSGVTTDRKLTLLSRALADLTGRATTMSTSELNAIFAASSAIMQPINSTNLQMRITSVTVTGATGSRVGRVAWSCAKGSAVTGVPANSQGTQASAVYPMTALTANSVYTIPAGFEDSDYFVVADAMYPYVPQFGYAWVGRIDLNQRTPWTVRASATVPSPGTCPT